MRSILKIDKPQILNVKFKKFKKFKKHHAVNKLKISSFFSAIFDELYFLTERVVLLEVLAGETFKINKFKFYNNNKKHVNLGVLIFLKINIFKKKILPCLSYFFIYQLFLYYEFFLKTRLVNFNEYDNYFWFKTESIENIFFLSFYFFKCWAQLANDIWSSSIFEHDTEIFDETERIPLKFVEHIKLDFVLYYKFNIFFLKILRIAKKNMLKLLIFFYKKFFMKKLFKRKRFKKLKLFLFKRYLSIKNNAKT